jgi:hypothetical protein
MRANWGQMPWRPLVYGWAFALFVATDNANDLNINDARVQYHYSQAGGGRFKGIADGI